jgi:hypothetical protein
MKIPINLYEYYIRIAVIIFAAITPFLCILSHGYLPSLSSYWKTDLQPLFIIANAATSYYLYSVKIWRPSALLLLLLTAFSVELFPLTHNFLAVIFFFMNIYPLYKRRFFKWTIWIYFSSLLVLPFSMIFAEIIAINAICLHHLLLLNKVYIIKD